MELPEEYELIEFFESEPELPKTNDTPWEYTEVKFSTKRGEDEVAVDIYAPSGKFKISWQRSGRQLLLMKLTQLEKITIDLQSKNEFLTAVGMISDTSVILKLRLKPFIAIEFEQRYSY